jgi:hypothetical protein
MFSHDIFLKNDIISYSLETLVLTVCTTFFNNLCNFPITYINGFFTILKLNNGNFCRHAIGLNDENAVFLAWSKLEVNWIFKYDLN